MTQPARSPYNQGAATTAGVSSEDNKAASGEEGYELADRDAATTQDVDDSTVYRTYKRRWFGLAQLVLLNIVVSWDWLTFAPVTDAAATYYGVNAVAINWLSTAFMLAFPVIAPVTIKILHLGPKPSIMVSATLVLLGNWIRFAGSYKFEPTGGKFGVVMFGQILTGLAQPFVLAAPTRYSDMWFTTRGRVAATAIMSLANPLGAALGQLIVPELVPGGKSEQVSRMVLYSSVASIPAFFIPARPPTPVAPSSKHVRPGIRASVVQVGRNLELWLVMLTFWFYVGLFNLISTLLSQEMKPHGFSEDDAGIGGGLLILAFVFAIKCLIPINAIAYLVFVWMPQTGSIAGPYVILALIGATGFSLVPCALELLTELSYPVSPEITSTIAWSGGQLIGAIFIIICGELKASDSADPPATSTRLSSSRPSSRASARPCPSSSASLAERTRLA
ncbi:unnamed protein product [Parascedosporium putredinis]|uniref:MFS general substrate transporter n=1 Tax=Parascedosporium putredinis TaxID=1442378 RepID=A0A9P1HC98_9PEZI|nr:unnamed protein product [Parascedosporium putredinis]CAI8004667.1 unnamed protein product [Parascedosporium putredinis]